MNVIKSSIWLIFFDDEVMAFSSKEKAWEYLVVDFKKHARDREWIEELAKTYDHCCRYDGDYFGNDSIDVTKIELDPTP